MELRPTAVGPRVLSHLRVVPWPHIKVCFKRHIFNLISFLMLKRLVLLLIIAFTFQLSWSTASAYCLHEQGGASKHFGHHQHEHPTEAGKTQSEKAPSSKKLVTHGDCLTCTHHGSLCMSDWLLCPLIIDPLVTYQAAASVVLPSPYLSVPERPKWSCVD